MGLEATPPTTPPTSLPHGGVRGKPLGMNNLNPATYSATKKEFPQQTVRRGGFNPSRLGTRETHQLLPRQTLSPEGGGGVTIFPDRYMLMNVRTGNNQLTGSEECGSMQTGSDPGHHPSRRLVELTRVQTANETGSNPISGGWPSWASCSVASGGREMWWNESFQNTPQRLLSSNVRGS